MPRVSVIIPTYNRADLLREAMASVLAQTYQDFEILVADDGSTDHTAQVVEAFCMRSGPRIRYLPLPHRGRPAAPRNAALAAAAGEYIAFLDSDDLFLPEKLARQIAALDADPGVDFVYSSGHFFTTDPTQTQGSIHAGLPQPSGWVFGDLLCGNFLFMPLILIHRRVFEKVGGFDERADLRVGEDYELWLRMALETPIRFVPGEVAAIRQHDRNISADSADMRRHVLRVLQRMDQRFPQAMAEHAAARHEGYARLYSGLAVDEWRSGRIRQALHHSRHALRHMLKLPYFGLGQLRTARKRRSARRRA